MLSIINQMKRYSTVIFGTPSLPAGTTDIEENTHNELGDMYTMAGKIEDRELRF